MSYSIEYSYKEKSTGKFHFVLIIGREPCEERLYFHVLSDMSGYSLSDPYYDPKTYMMFGCACIAEREFIKDEIKKHLRD